MYYLNCRNKGRTKEGLKLEIISIVNGKYTCADELAVGRTNKN